MSAREAVTPEMIRAGVAALLPSLSDRVPDDWVLAPLVVAEVYRAMARLRPLESQSEAKTKSFGHRRDAS